MKTFAEYLTESVRTFQYRIKIAGDFNPEVMDKFKQEVEKFEVLKLSAPKKTPVQKSPAGFPELANQSVSIMDAEFNYPTTPQEITELWSRAGGNPNHIRIITSDFDDSVSEQASDAEDSPVLQKDLPKTDSKQKAAKDAHADASVVIRNSADGAKFTVAGGKTPPAKTTNQLPIGDKSPIGGKNKRPEPKSFAR